MQQDITHIIGAGLAGLSAATALAEKGRKVIVHEAAAQAGGRCRSYQDAAFGGIIDNGNHLLLSGNDSAMEYLRRIDADAAFSTKRLPVFDFIDAASLRRWTLRLNCGRIPFWLLDKTRRVPDTKITDYVSILRLLWAAPNRTVGSVLGVESPLYSRLWHPLLLSALNTDLGVASARLAAAILRESLLKGGKACIPLVTEGLASTFIDPALRYLEARGGQVRFSQRLRQIRFEGAHAVSLDFASGESVPLSSGDTLICAVPAWNVSSLLPGVEVPEETRAILNAHFRISAPAGFPPILGVIHAATEWIFSFSDRLSVTISDADRFMQDDREALAKRLWQEVASITGLATQLPPWQIVKEKRATFAATPAQDAKRPGTRTSWQNIFLAGDYVQTGLPATIEGSIRSGVQAAKLVIKAS